MSSSAQPPQGNQPQEPHGEPLPQQGQPQYDGQPQQGQPYPQQGQHGQQYQAPQAYGQQGGKYGTAEYDPNQYTGALDRPKAFDTLLKLTLVSLAVYVINGIVSILASSSMDYVQLYKDQGMSTEQAEQAAQMAGGMGPVGSIVGLVIGIILYLLVYSGLKKGKNWARVLGIIFAILSVIGSVFALFGVGMMGSWAVVSVILTVIALIVDIMWLVTAFKAPVAQYFKQPKAVR